MKNYTHFQYIAYQVPTVLTDGMTDLPMYGIPVHPLTVDQPRLEGNLSDVSNETQGKIQRIVASMLRAESNPKMDRSLNTLKVFTAPEFYFRPSTIQFSYSCKEYRAIKDILRKTIRSNLKFCDWLVIPGTIMWTFDDERDSRSGTKPLTPADKVFLNSAISIYLHDVNIIFTKKIEKMQASWIDGLPTGRHTGQRPKPPVTPSNFSTDEIWPSKYNDPQKKNKHIFNAGNINIGLEICLEHAQGLLKTLGKLGGKELDLQILIAGGMPIEHNSIATKLNGYILRNDGYAYNNQTECKQLGSLVPVLNNHDVAMGATIDIKAGDSLHIQPPILVDNNHWNNHPQQIKIYEPQPLP